LHAMTGHEAYLKLCFRVRKNAFKQDTLSKALALRPLADYPGHEGYSRDHRGEVANERSVVQSVVVTLVKEAEAKLPNFQEFLKQAVASFNSLAGDGTAVQRVEAAMPWKKDGPAWHLGDKGFPPGKGCGWDKAVLPKFLDVARGVAPELAISWDLRDAITVRVPDSKRFWLRLKTKEPNCLEVWLPCKPGQFNLAAWEAIGVASTLDSERWEGCDTLALRFKTSAHLNAKALAPLLKKQLQGFLQLRGDVEITSPA